MIMTEPASSEPGSEISSFVDSGDDFSEKLVATCSMTSPLIEGLVVQDSNGVNTNMVGTALPSTVTALPLSGAALPKATPSTIQSIVVPFECSGHTHCCWFDLYAAH